MTYCLSFAPTNGCDSVTDFYKRVKSPLAQLRIAPGDNLDVLNKGSWEYRGVISEIFMESDAEHTHVTVGFTSGRVLEFRFPWDENKHAVFTPEPILSRIS